VGRSLGRQDNHGQIPKKPSAGLTRTTVVRSIGDEGGGMKGRDVIAFFSCRRRGMQGPHPAVAHRSFLEMTNEGAALRHGAAIISPAGSSWAVPRVRRAAPMRG